MNHIQSFLFALDYSALFKSHYLPYAGVAAGWPVGTGPPRGTLIGDGRVMTECGDELRRMEHRSGNF
jgi:hypothetical protein